jgi:hypothetical protein
MVCHGLGCRNMNSSVTCKVAEKMKKYCRTHGGAEKSQYITDVTFQMIKEENTSGTTNHQRRSQILSSVILFWVCLMFLHHGVRFH